jgi:hypothetical protein
MAIDVAQWLHGLGLGQYAATFARNDVDGSILLELTAEDLVSLGVYSVGHRRRLPIRDRGASRRPSRACRSVWVSHFHVSLVAVLTVAVAGRVGRRGGT